MRAESAVQTEKYNIQNEQFYKLQVDYETLAVDTKKLVQVEKLLNEMKLKYRK